MRKEEKTAIIDELLKELCKADNFYIADIGVTVLFRFCKNGDISYNKQQTEPF